MQQLLEDVALHLVDFYLGDILKETGKLAFAGGVALNVKLNQRLMALPYVDELFVQPAASDSGTAIGAASYARTRSRRNHPAQSTPTLDQNTRRKSVLKPVNLTRKSPIGKSSRILLLQARKFSQPATPSLGSKAV
jgi:predicted NodU family carbamoyl transferase